MNTYIIPIFREIHYKLEIQADSLVQAQQRVELNGLTAGKLLSSVMTEAQELDEEGILLYNAESYPEEVAQLSGLTVEQVQASYTVGGR